MSSQHPQTAAQQISAHGGRVTRTRVAVLELLQRSAQPLSHDEVADGLRQDTPAHDRVTLYRTLEWLVEHGIAHRLSGTDRVWRFSVPTAEASHHHAHFQCDRCGQLFCLEQLQPALAVSLPAGYQLDRAELILHGACPRCCTPQSALEKAR